MHVILRGAKNMQKIRRRGTFLEWDMIPRNFNEERSHGVSGAMTCHWAEVWFSRLRRFLAKYTRCKSGGIWRERSLLLTGSTFSLRVATYQLCHDKCFHNADTSSRRWWPWVYSYKTKRSCVRVVYTEKLIAHITHFNCLQLSSTAESTSRVYFASSLTSRPDVTYLAYGEQFHLGSES